MLSSLISMFVIFQFPVARPFYVVLESTPVVRRGETVTVKAILVNNKLPEANLLLTLPASKDYAMVVVGKGGDVQRYSPEILRGQHQHFVSVSKPS